MSLANNNPATRASYSAWLLDVLNSNLNAISIWKLSGPSSTIPAPLPFLLDAPSTYNVHCSYCVVVGIWMMKSARDCALIGPLGSYLIPNTESSIDHVTILPASFGFLKILDIGPHNYLMILKIWPKTSRGVHQC